MSPGPGGCLGLVGGEEGRNSLIQEASEGRMAREELGLSMEGMAGEG